MTRRLASLSGLLLIAAVAAGCGSDEKSSDSTAAATPTTAAAAPTTAAAVETTAAAGAETTVAAATGDLPSEATVDIKQFKFMPDEVHVAVGATVTWTNSDNQNHTATASGQFDSEAIAAGATGTATFDTAGTFAYICSFHPFMKGTVVVGS